MHVSKLTLDEIREQALEKYGSEWAFGNFTDENGRYICRADDDDEYYTDGEHFLPVDEITDYIEWRDAWLWAVETDIVSEIYDYFSADFKKAIRCCEGFELTTDDVAEGYRQYAIENADDFLEWKWGINNDKHVDKSNRNIRQRQSMQSCY